MENNVCNKVPPPPPPCTCVQMAKWKTQQCQTGKIYCKSPNCIVPIQKKLPVNVPLRQVGLAQCKRKNTMELHRMFPDE